MDFLSSDALLPFPSAPTALDPVLHAIWTGSFWADSIFRTTELIAEDTPKCFSVSTIDISLHALKGASLMSLAKVIIIPPPKNTRYKEVVPRGLIPSFWEDIFLSRLKKDLFFGEDGSEIKSLTLWLEIAQNPSESLEIALKMYRQQFIHVFIVLPTSIEMKPEAKHLKILRQIFAKEGLVLQKLEITHLTQGK
jgi:hypothetical protein